MDAVCLFSLADISLANTEPALTVGMTKEELMAVVLEPLVIDLPCHTVAVERGGKETTSASLKSADPIQQDGANFLISAARKKNPISAMKKKTWGL